MNLVRYLAYGWFLALLAFCAKASQHPRSCRCAQCRTEENDRHTSARQLCELMGMRSGSLNDAQSIAFALRYDREALSDTQRQTIDDLAQRHPQLLNDLLLDVQA